jgi:hypothetical protein
MDKPIRYAVHEGVHIAYQVVGDGPIDLLYTPGIWSTSCAPGDRKPRMPLSRQTTFNHQLV